MELNREQIVKALECCSDGGECHDCPYCEKCLLPQWQIVKDALALIRELSEENERLTAQVEMWKTTAYCEKDRVESIKRDTVRKMQEMIKAICTVNLTAILRCVDQMAQEMLEDAT